MRVFAAVATGLGLLVSGCVDSSSETDTLGSSSGTANATSADATTSINDSDSGAVPPGCGDNLLEDPGFEGGASNSGWFHDSELFGTPICDSNCTDDIGANPFSGSWWVWFGGVAQPDVASVRQVVLIPQGNAAIVRFRFSLNAASGTGNDLFSVVLDEETIFEDTIFMVSDADAASFGGWRVVEEDISRFADGREHVLSFEATLTGVGVTNFFVDDVEVLLCEQDGSSSSDSSSSEDTGAAASTSGADTSGT